MVTAPSLCIVFDSTDLKPTEIFINGRTNEETAQVEEIARRIIKAIKGEDKCLAA